MSRFWLLGTLLVTAGLLLGFAGRVRGQETRPAGPARGPVRLAPDAVAVRILLGRNDTAPTPWDGSLAVTGGALLHLEGRRFRQNDALTGEASWKAQSRRQQPRAGAARRQGAGANQPVVATGIVAFVKGGSQAEVRVTTPRGEFRFQPAQLAWGKQSLFLEGAAAVDRVVPDFGVTGGADTEDGFPAAAAGPDGTLWVAYVAYRYGTGPAGTASYLRGMQKEPESFAFLKTEGNGDQVRLAKISGSGESAGWTEVADLTEPGQDVYRPALAVDGGGAVWVVWSQNARGNWDLYGRRFQDGRLSRALRLTQDPGPDLHPALARDEAGSVWLAWQGFRNEAADIFVASARRGEERWSKPETVSSSAADDWDPQVAGAPDGSVYVAWDTYDRGNYDVMLRRLQRGRWGEAVPVADTRRFEARPSLACDRQSRAWVAWEEAPEGWGKDFGFYVQDQGVALYRGHTLNLRCFADGQPYGTAGSLADVLANPAGGFGGRRAGGGAGAGGMQLGQAARQQAVQNASFPRLGTDGAGRVSLTYRRPLAQLQAPIGTSWFSFLTTCTGDHWTTPVLLPDSDGLLDVRPALVAGGPGGLSYAVHAADGRNHDFGHDPRNEIYVAPLPADLAGSGPAAAPALTKEEGRGVPAPDPGAEAERADVARMRGFRSRAGGTAYRLMRGDFHRHTEISQDGGGDGPLIDVYRYALDAADMDWICAQDHDNGNGREYTWWQIQKLNDAFHTDHRFVPLFGYERSVRYPDGHRNVMFAYRGIRPLPRLTGTTQGNGVSPGDTKMLYRYLHAFHGLCNSHTSATDMGTDWRDSDPEVEPEVEIYQGDRQNYEYQGAPRSGTEGNSPGGFQPAGFVWNAFAKGIKLGFQCSSDHISTHISYAVAYVTEPSREAILDAFRKRHTYGATDNIVLEVRSGDHLMGDEFETKRPPRLQIRATGTGPVARVIVAKDNKVVYTATPKQAEVNLEWMDAEAKPGVSYYYVRLEQENGQLAWASPMWVHYQP